MLPHNHEMNLLNCRVNRKTLALYYNGQPDLTDIVGRIRQFIDRM